MSVSSEEQFKRHYEAHLKHLRLKGLQPKTTVAYARAVRRVGTNFDGCIDDLSELQMLGYPPTSTATTGSSNKRFRSSLATLGRSNLIG